MANQIDTAALVQMLFQLEAAVEKGQVQSFEVGWNNEVPQLEPLPGELYAKHMLSGLSSIEVKVVIKDERLGKAYAKEAANRPQHG